MYTLLVLLLSLTIVGPEKKNKITIVKNDDNMNMDYYNTSHVHYALEGSKPFQNPHPFSAQYNRWAKKYPRILIGYIDTPNDISFGSTGHTTTIHLAHNSVRIPEFEPGLPIKFQIVSDDNTHWVRGILTDTPDVINLLKLKPNTTYYLPSHVHTPIYLNE